MADNYRHQFHDAQTRRTSEGQGALMLDMPTRIDPHTDHILRLVDAANGFDQSGMPEAADAIRAEIRRLKHAR